MESGPVEQAAEAPASGEAADAHSDAEDVQASATTEARDQAAPAADTPRESP